MQFLSDAVLIIRSDPCQKSTFSTRKLCFVRR